MDQSNGRDWLLVLSHSSTGLPTSDTAEPVVGVSLLSSSPLGERELLKVRILSTSPYYCISSAKGWNAKVLFSGKFFFG